MHLNKMSKNLIIPMSRLLSSEKTYKWKRNDIFSRNNIWIIILMVSESLKSIRRLQGHNGAIVM